MIEDLSEFWRDVVEMYRTPPDVQCQACHKNMTPNVLYAGPDARGRCVCDDCIPDHVKFRVAMELL